ncbi:MAG: MFS transporter permease [Desulfobacter sp.]
MTEKKVKVIPRENAVFRMDENGVWHNAHGRFEHPKIISYFNRSIQKDSQGYFVSQMLGEVVEKVYFPFVDTALFVVDIRIKDNIELVLNTGNTVLLDPSTLHTRDDSLFCRTPDDLVKFNQHALARLARCLDETDQGLMLNMGGASFPIPDK